MSDQPIQAMRRSYDADQLVKSAVGDDPLDLFAAWFEDACQRASAEWFEVNAMTLATASADGEVSARIVLLKGHDAEGFRFFTNYTSQKGRQLAENPRASLVFFWPHVERQVRIVGTAERLSREASAEYFATRPRESQIGAVASAQSEVIASRELLAAQFARVEKAHADGEVPMPDDWGGYQLRPSSIEFWQGRPGRLHDRLRFSREASGWRVERLCP